MELDELDLEKMLLGKSYRTAGGLHVVLDTDPAEAGDGAPWTATVHGLAFPHHPPPSLLGQVIVVVHEANLGLPTLSEGEVRELLEPLPVDRALVWTARNLLRLWDADDGPEDQLALAQQIFPPDAGIHAAFRHFLSNPDHDERRVLFSEQMFHVLLRLCLESCDGDPDLEWGRDEEGAMRRALLGVTSLTGEGASRVEGARELADWLGFFMQNGAYNSKEQPLLAYQRAFRVFVELAADEEAREHHSFVDLDHLSVEAFGTSLPELFAVAFAASASASQEPEDDPTSYGVVPELGRYLAPTKLADRGATFNEALSAPRDFYVEGFKRSRDDPVRLAWDVTPFLQKPFHRLTDEGPLLLLSPRAIQSWLTDGFYYRLLDASADAGSRDAYTTFIGWLYERYLVEVFALALPDRNEGEGKVHGDYAYGKGGGERTSDLAIDFGADLVLGEIVSTRLPLGVRAEADEAELEKFLTRAVIDKLKQLDRVVEDLEAGRAQIPGVDIKKVERIWPALINVGELTEGEVLFSFLERKAPGALKQKRCEPLTLLGVDDAETLAGMVANGESLVKILATKLKDDYQQLGLDRWITDKWPEPPPRLHELEQRWEQMVEELVSVLNLGPRPDGDAGTG